MARKIYVPHNKKCYACGKPQGNTLMGYDPRTLKTYCSKRKCRNQDEIPKDIELIPVDTDSLKEAIHSHYFGDTEEMILSLMGKTASARLDPAHIMHLMKVAEINGFDKIQHTLVDIIENDMKERNLDHVILSESDFNEIEEEEEVVTPAPKKKAAPKTKQGVKEEVEEEEDGGDEIEF